MIYMDNAATTRMHPQVVRAMLPYMENRYANPSGIYTFSKGVSGDIARARKNIAGIINCDSSEIYFTSGGTEADNWALKMVSDEHSYKGHIITTAFEHHAILKSVEQLEKKGVKVTKIMPENDGRISLKSLENAIRRDTILISVMMANNEIGTIQNVTAIGELCREYGIVFHTDAVQAFTNVPIDVKKSKIDMLSVSGHKIRGPKGIGFLYIRNGCLTTPFMTGGGQEMGMRAGTENVAGIIGLSTAAVIADNNMKYRTSIETKVRDYMIDKVFRTIKGVKLNGSAKNRLPNNMNFSFENIDGATLILMLDQQGICASAGSACSSKDSKPSHVLKAIGLSDEDAYSSVRFTINEQIDYRQVDYVVKCLAQNIEELRRIQG